MNQKSAQYIREGEYKAEVEVAIDDAGGEWSPTVGIDGVRKLDRVRDALRRQDFAAAAREATVFKLVPQVVDPGQKGNLGFGEDPQSEFKS